MIVVYLDNLLIMVGVEVECWFLCKVGVFGELGECYGCYIEFMYMLMKVEMYNYLMVILLFLGVVIGVGGEICDEGVMGCGVCLKVGFMGFIVLNFDLLDVC